MKIKFTKVIPYLSFQLEKRPMIDDLRIDATRLRSDQSACRSIILVFQRHAFERH